MATAQTVRVLCIHGVGNHELIPQAKIDNRQKDWRAAIEHAVARQNPTVTTVCEFLEYDQLFKDAGLTVVGTTAAVMKLLYSGIYHGIGDVFRQPRGLFDFPERVRWTAGMVVQWVENEDLKKKTRAAVKEHVSRFQPDVIFAHSLGSLIAYDALGHGKGIKNPEKITFVSAGSQIGNPFVRNSFAGRINPLPVRFWYHLYNEEDMVLTAAIPLTAANFRQLDTPFDIEGLLDHEALKYIEKGHEAWGGIVGTGLRRAFARPSAAKSRTAPSKRPVKRALLVGINEYPDPGSRLEGCLNDVFLMSSVLQEIGFSAENIRVVFNERATAEGIRERMRWLLDGAGAGDHRIFYYSGHGAQIPAYGSEETVDKVDECLVPHDFDWNRENAITDDEIYDLYSQLPYETNFAMFLDCCHSGGMARDGGLRIRGMNPPDDIRHRMLRWDAEHEMWVPRDPKTINKDFGKWSNGVNLTGRAGNVSRLGCASALRGLANKQYNSLRKEFGHHGPYLPMIFQACEEEQYSYEYRHGVVSYGAFTFVIAKTLRNACKAGSRITFKGLVDSAAKELGDLGYEQRPALLGPKHMLKAEVPWHC